MQDAQDLESSTPANQASYNQVDFMKVKNTSHWNRFTSSKLSSHDMYHIQLLQYHYQLETWHNTEIAENQSYKKYSMTLVQA